MNRRHAITLLGSAALAPRLRASSPLPPPHIFERALMGTRFEIRCHEPDSTKARKASDQAFAAAEQINAVASDYIADSELLLLTRHPLGEPVPVSPLLFRLISEALQIAGKTSGRFDPTLGPLTRLWRESRRRGTLPAPAAIAAARAASGWKNLQLDTEHKTAVFLQPGMRLDLGGIAKGQAADAMLAIMHEQGIPSSCITAGGDVRLGSPPPDSEGWNVTVRVSTPDHDHDTKPLRLSNCAVSTSGDLHQSILIDGIRYSHIIDPATGLGLTRQIAATIIAPTAMLSDALATACCVAPPAEAEPMALATGATQVLLAL